MASINPGMIGLVTGRVGNLVVASRKGVPYVRAAPKRRRKKASEKELANRKKFALAQEWLKPIKTFIRAGFKGYSPTVEGFVAAKSHLLKNAFVKTDDTLYIDPALVLVSFGDLPLPADIKVEKQGDNELLFTWHHEPSNTDHKADQVMILAYCMSRRAEDILYNTTGQLRYTGRDVLKVYKGDTYHVYIAFTAADRSRQSMSVYLGEITM